MSSSPRTVATRRRHWSSREIKMNESQSHSKCIQTSHNKSHFHEKSKQLLRPTVHLVVSGATPSKLNLTIQFVQVVEVPKKSKQTENRKCNHSSVVVNAAVTWRPVLPCNFHVSHTSPPVNTHTTTQFSQHLSFDKCTRIRHQNNNKNKLLAAMHIINNNNNNDRR